MPRKDSSVSNSGHHGLNDVIGVVLLGFALLLFVSMCSFDPSDISSNTTATNESKHNWIGPVGAWMAQLLFQGFGVGAFVLPIVMVVGGLGCFFEGLAYLRRRWVWSVILVLCCIGLLDLYTDHRVMDRLAVNPKAPAGLLERVSRNLSTSSAGGITGHALNSLFHNFGTAGATILYVLLDLVSMLFLTNFQLGNWVRGLVARRNDLTEPGDEKLPAEERQLVKRARELEREKRKLEQAVEKSARKAEAAAKTLAPPAEDKAALGADLQPVPEPTVRDLSIVPHRPSKAKKAEKSDRFRDTESPEEGMVIPEQEITAASTADVLGRKSDPAGDGGESPDFSGPVATGDGLSPFAAANVSADAAPSALPRSKPALKKVKPITVASTPLIGNYQLPHLDLLNHAEPNLVPSETKEQLMERARLMQQTLAQFEIEVQLGDITKGPTITRYELHPAPGVRLEKISALSNNIAAALKAERINVLAPVPGKSSVGIEVPNLIKTKVIMRDLLESEEWKTTKARIPLALGKDVYGQPIIADLAEMPHVLIAGSTGSGKSVCINTIVASLLYKFSPDQLRFVMIDPKVVELQQYNALPHLVVPVVTDPKKVILALRWVVNEMEKRYQIFARVGVRNVSSFNSRPKDKPMPRSAPELPLAVRKEKIETNSDGFAVELDEQIVVPRDEDIVIPEKLSYIVVIIDELADLMLVAPADVEMAIARITQMARAAGIHCIVATQRPSVDVITGVIKSNIPARIAFQVASSIDSRTILDTKGADKLLGKGDMLFLPPGSAKLNRAQGALITDKELQDIVDFIATQGKPSYELEIHNALQKMQSSAGQGFELEEGGSGEDEALIQQCIEVIRSEQKASVSLMQRRLRLGYTRAARIMDELEQRGIVGPSKGAEPRDILIDLDGGNAEGATSGHGV